MKRLIYMAIVAMTALAVSCNKDNGGEEGTDTGIVGTWTMHAESAHYFQVSLDAKGSFDWQVLGVSEFRETGSYNMDGDVITLETKKYYDRWDDATGTEYKDKWIEKDGMPSAGYPEEFNGKRTMNIKVLKHGFIRCALVNDPQFGDALKDVYLFLVGSNQGLKPSDLDGTWIYANAAGAEVAKVVFNGNKYSRKVYMEYQGKVSDLAWDDLGTWSYDKGVITFSGAEYESIASFRIFLDDNKLYISNPLDWGFDAGGYTYVKQ